MPATQRHPQGGTGKKAGQSLGNKASGPANNRVGKNERNGLLLLSAKKSSTSGGLLSSKSPSAASRPLPSLNLQTQSNASTHQFLLSAVVGASQVELRSQPDAWGVADKQHVPVPLELNQMEDINPHEDAKPSEEGHYDHSRDGSPRYETEASWDEYGGRGVQSGNLDEQCTHMSRLAKQGAEHRRREEEQRFTEQRNKAAQRLQELDDRAGRGYNSGERKLWDPEGDKNRQERPNRAPESPVDEKEALIHLSSYEDRDRGMRSGSSAPRMLFDPKSGSMVEVKARDEKANSKRKERKPRQRKDRDSKGDAPADGKKNPRKMKGRKESMSSEKSENEAKPKSSSRLPRTCGVLYGRNEKGNLICKDECDGDLGYGCHSVRGGRVRNAEGYQKFVEEHAEIFQRQKELMQDGYEGGYLDDESKKNGLTLQTGFQLEDTAEPLEWIKAHDKIELVTGADDSPTLKPTAKEWAPSQTALAAAAAVAANAKQEFSGDNSMESDEDAVEDEIEDDEDGNSGLGFDPMQDMDFMSSPTHLPHPEDAIASVDLGALSLETSAFPSGESATKGNIFAFGSTTWGASGGDDKGVLGWGTSAGSDNGTGGGLFGSDVFRSTSDDKQPAGFLSIPSAHSWGSSPIPGLNLSAANHDSSDG